MSKYFKIILAIFLVAILGIGSYFIYRGFSSKENSGEILGENVTEDKISRYQITIKEEEEFYQLIGRGVTETKLAEIKGSLDQLKERYEEGYFVIVKVSSLIPDSFRQFYEDGSPANLSLLVRELTALVDASQVLEKRGYGEGVAFKKVFLIEDKEVFLELIDLSISSPELRNYFENSTDFDKENFLKSANSLYDILEGINANLKGLRLILAFEDKVKSGSRGELKYHLRRVYHLETYLWFLREKSPSEWKKIVGDKETVFLIQKLWFESEREVKKAFETDLFSDYQSNQKLVFNPENRGIFNHLEQEAGLGEISDWTLDDQRLKGRGIELDLFEY